MNINPLFKTGILVAATSLALDQATKWWIIEKIMQPPRIIPVTGFFNLVMVWNRGVSFGMFNDNSEFNAWIFSGLSLVVVAFLVIWLHRVDSNWTAFALGLVIGGALGNVADRLHQGAVTDFLDFYIGSYHWPAFNTADISITIGAIMLVLETLFTDEKKPKNNPS